jgi:hypothetical protein
MSDESVEVDFGAGPVTVPESTRLVNLSGTKGAIPVPGDGPVDWAQLAKLPYATTLMWSGPERGVAAAVARNRITYLEWADAVGDVDLSPTAVAEVRLGGKDLRSVRIPASTTMLLLQDPPPALRVDAPGEGRGLDLRIFFVDQDPFIPAGVANARKVWVKAGRDFSARTLSGLTAVESLDIELLDPPGTLTDTGELAAHRGLGTLVIENAYDWDPAELPELPALRELEVNGTRKSTAAAVRARFKGTPVSVSVSGAKSESWLDANIDNPFLDWVEDSKPFGAAACKAYAKAAKAIDAIPAGEADAADRVGRAEAALRGFVADLNAVQRKYHLIDTMNREHAAEVFADLAGRAGVPGDTADAWFEDRDF